MGKKLLKLFDENGFLLFLFICVCIVAAGTIFISTKGLESVNDGSGDHELIILDDPAVNDVASNEDLMEIVDEGTTGSEEVGDEPIEETFDTAEDKTEETLSETEEVLGEAEELEELPEEGLDDELEFIEDKPKDKPEEVNNAATISGNIITDYTVDSLIYSETLEEWRGHCGIDIAGDIGEPVIALMDGTIKEVYDDDLWGITIIIDHGEGLETRYSNLGTKEMVRAGLQVKAGDHIGTIGKTAIIEMMMEPHLHLEAIKNGKIVDPRSISK